MRQANLIRSTAPAGWNLRGHKFQMGYIHNASPETLTANELWQRSLIHPYCDECGADELGSQAELRSKGWCFDLDGADVCPAHNPHLETVAFKVPCPMCESKDTECFFCNGELVISRVQRCSVTNEELRQAVDRAEAALEFIPLKETIAYLTQGWNKPDEVEDIPECHHCGQPVEDGDFPSCGRHGERVAA